MTGRDDTRFRKDGPLHRPSAASLYWHDSRRGRKYHPAVGIKDNLVRYSLGIENAEDISKNI